MKDNQQSVKYGAFTIKDDTGYWNGDADVVIQMHKSASEHCQLEGIWNPHHHELKDEYRVAMSGLCIWAKYDCIFKFKPKSKGNPGAQRSLSNPKDRADILKRLHHDQHVETIVMSREPFGLYQSQMIGWQADTVLQFDIEKLYYALPIEEYTATLGELKNYLPPKCVEQIIEILNSHHDQLVTRITNDIKTKVEFVNPMQMNSALSLGESYTWPYENLSIDLGIEEMEEVRIPYQAMKNGTTVPPILLGMLGVPCPYYELRHPDDERIELFPFS